MSVEVYWLTCCPSTSLEFSLLPPSLFVFLSSLPPGNETDRGYKAGRDQDDALEGHEGLIAECLPVIGGVLLKVLREMDGAISEISLELTLHLAFFLQILTQLKILFPSSCNLYEA